MPVFISHSSKDDAIAGIIYRRLTNLHGITCYLDDIDPELQGTKNATDVILKRLDQCTNLLAVVTANTRESWWVPFEIGVARRAPRFITTYTYLYSTLPDYLKEWPVLSSDAHIDIFAKEYKRTHHLSGTDKLMLANESFSNKSTTTELFHYGLRAKLGQI